MSQNSFELLHFIFANIPVKRPVDTPALLSAFFLACGMACELCAQANSGVLPIAQPLFSGFMPKV